METSTACSDYICYSYFVKQQICTYHAYVAVINNIKKHSENYFEMSYWANSSAASLHPVSEHKLSPLGPEPSQTLCDGNKHVRVHMTKVCQGSSWNSAFPDCTWAIVHRGRSDMFVWWFLSYFHTFFHTVCLHFSLFADFMMAKGRRSGFALYCTAG